MKSIIMDHEHAGKAGFFAPLTKWQLAARVATIGKLGWVLAASTTIYSSNAEHIPLPFVGVNMPGGEWGAPYPIDSEYSYFQGKGMNIFRLPFAWETLQPSLGQDLDPNELNRLRVTVDLAVERGLVVVLDVHNYA